MSRWSIENVLRQVRGARGSAGRALTKHAKQDRVAELLATCMAHLTAAEHALLAKNRRAVERETRRRAA